jgi:hypothetical protein
MKKANWEWIIVLVIIVFVIGIGIGIYLSTNNESHEPEQKDRQGKLDIVKAKIKALEQRVKNELAQLKLTTEMETALSLKVDRFCIFIGAILFVLLALIAACFYINGFDVLTSILSTAGIISLTLPFLSIVMWKTVDFNSVVAFTRTKIKDWLNKKFGHDPDNIVMLNTSIIELKGSIEQHNTELNVLLASNPE